MKLLLADAPHLFIQKKGVARYTLPLGLGYIGSFLEAEHDVSILLPDTRPLTHGDPWRILRSTIASESPDVVGITAVTALYPAAVRLAREVKKVNPQIVTVLGGAHASCDPEGALASHPAFDVVVVGEGEITMRDLLRGLESDPFRPEAIPGLCWVDQADGNIRRSGYRQPIPHLDRLPPPLRKNLVWSDDIHDTLYQTMITSRGCPYDCIYCAAPFLSNGRVRYRSPEKVVAEIAHLQQRLNIPGLFFHDSVFTLHRRRTQHLCELIIQHGLQLPFSCQTRVEHVDDALLAIMKAAGCDHIFFGIESGCLETLKHVGKEFNLENVRNAVNMVKLQGIQCSGFFMIGFPWETPAMMEQTADFALSLNLTSVSLFSATPLPGSRLWEMSAARRLPNRIDFRLPEVNLTRMPDQSYADLFTQIQARLDRYNQDVMMQRVRHMQPSVNESVQSPVWIDGAKKE